MRMRGKSAVVTGAGSGLGRATALRLAAEGARVACVDRVGEHAEATAAAIVAAGGGALALQADVTDEGACGRMIEATLARFGALTTLVNSAGVTSAAGGAPPGQEWRRVVEVNLTGTWLPSCAARGALAASGHGSITNLASIYGVVGGSMSPAYAASKGGVANLTRQLAMQWAPAIRVNCVCPGHVKTPLTSALMADPAWRARVITRYPLGRFGHVDDVAAAILYLASDEAGFVTGVALPVDGGYTAV
ncbi:MAG TPA: SDR family NAD(P)-dependent oxidoreductase [Methylomirabilota bacterium]|nr:SDR family NAD(P)-dependent oxidoreductase [Methylomirabilota bacterium]